MKIFHGISHIRRFYKNPIVALGVFDGLHQGHQKLLRFARKRVRAVKGTFIVITFVPHPVHILRPQIYSPLIVSVSYRLFLLEQLGVDVCIIIPFNKRFSQITPELFIKEYLINRIKPREIVVGDDFRFGHNRKGKWEDFVDYGNKYGFKVRSLTTKFEGRKMFSSSQIRQLILAGEVKSAAKMLGRPVSILGKVVHGDARGFLLGYPTANINPSNEILPPSGVFFVNVYYKGKYYHGLANIGRRPSFKRIDKVNIEVHIFNFKRNLYGKEIIVEFLKKTRDEKVFSSQSQLIEQIRKDEKKALLWFSKTKGKIFSN